MRGFWVDFNETSGFINAREFLDQMGESPLSKFRALCMNRSLPAEEELRENVATKDRLLLSHRRMWFILNYRHALNSGGFMVTILRKYINNFILQKHQSDHRSTVLSLTLECQVVRPCIWLAWRNWKHIKSGEPEFLSSRSLANNGRIKIQRG